MTKENIYTELLKYINTLPEDDKNFVNKLIDREEMHNSEYGVFILADMAINLKNDIRNENAKSAGKSNLQKAANEIIKSAKNTPNTSAHGVIVCGNNTYVCDGYQGIKFKTEVDLPEAPKGNAPNMDGIFNPLYTANNINLTLPTVADLKTFIKLKTAELKAVADKKADKTVFYDFGDGLPMVNAKYLLNAIDATGAKTAKIASAMSIILFEGDDADAILCPIRKKSGKCA